MKKRANNQIDRWSSYRADALLLIIILSFFFPTAAHAAKHALLVGIADYKSLPATAKKGGIDLKGPENDVNLILDALTGRYGFERHNISVLTGPQATRKKIAQAFHHRLIDGSRPGDVVVFYFSGHGSQVPDQNDDELDGMDEVLCPYDFTPKRGRNLILDDELGRWLQQLADRTAVAIIDSCHSGGALRAPDHSERFIQITDYDPSPVAKEPIQGTDMPDHTIFMAASREHQPSLEVLMGNGFFGVFTYGLSEAMQRNPMGSYETLFQQTRSFVGEILNKRRLFQRPILVARSDKKGVVAFRQIQADMNRFHITRLNRFIEGFDPRVSFTVQALSKTAAKETSALKQLLQELPDVRVVQSGAHCDYRVRVDQSADRLYAELIDNAGVVQPLGPFNHIRQAIQALHPAIENTKALKALVKLRQPHPPFRIHLKPRAENRYRYKVNEELAFTLESEKEGYLLMLSASRNGAVHMLLPNAVEPGAVHGGREIQIPTPAMIANHQPLIVSPPVGEEIIKVIASPEPLVRSRKAHDLIQGLEKTHSYHEILIRLSNNEIPWAETAIVIQSYE